MRAVGTNIISQSDHGSNYRTQTNCRICKSGELIEYINLGEHPLANAFIRPSAIDKPEPRYPLRVLFCNLCGLSQLAEIVKPDILYRDYIYFSSAMPYGAHFEKYAEDVVSDYIRSKRDMVVEIGSNDGYLLSEIKNRDTRALGIDPAQNIAAEANRRGIETVPDFFSDRLARRIVRDRGPARVILANNVLDRIDDLHDFAAGINTLLVSDGVFIFEAGHIMDMFETGVLGTIHHERLSHLSLLPLIHLLREHGMEVFDVKIMPVRGHAMRCYVGKKNIWPVKPNVKRMLEAEMDVPLDKASSYRDLAGRIQILGEEVTTLIRTLKKSGKRIACYGASAKGNTLLNYLGLGPDILDYATEELSSKIGLVTPGMHIPIVDIAWARENPPDYYLLLAWNYENIILKKEKEFRKQGGKFIVPVGEERIV